MELADKAEHITLVHRRDEYRGMPDSVTKIKQLAAEGKITEVLSAKVSAIDGADGQLSSVTIQPKGGDAIEYLMAQNIQTKGEFYLADALQIMIERGAQMGVHEVEVWQDTGKPETTSQASSAAAARRWLKRVTAWSA